MKRIFVISGPRFTGKTTLIEELRREGYNNCIVSTENYSDELNLNLVYSVIDDFLIGKEEYLFLEGGWVDSYINLKIKGSELNLLEDIIKLEYNLLGEAVTITHIGCFREWFFSAPYVKKSILNKNYSDSKDLFIFNDMRQKHNLYYAYLEEYFQDITCNKSYVLRRGGYIDLLSQIKS